MHFSTGVGECMNPFPKSLSKGCQADPSTLTFLEKVLDDEKPDLVVLTGDQIFGQKAPDSITAMLKVVAPFIERKIPYAMVFGNHDDEGSLGREELMKFVTLLPYSVSQPGPEDIEGVGNYVLQVFAPKNQHYALTLYFLDTHTYSQDPKTNPGYDYIKEDQLEFLEEEYRRVQPLQAEYTHIHMSMAFFHIPLPEYRNTDNLIVGNYTEACTAPRYNSGARDVLSKIGVSVVSVGHDHVNDFCMFDKKVIDHRNQNIWLCHGGGLGEGGYGGYGGYIRRLRFFEVDTQADTISSYKIRKDAPTNKFDTQVLVEGGKVHAEQ